MSTIKKSYNYTSSSISTSEVTTLKHEVLDDAVELAALVSLANSLLCKLDKVLDSFRDGASKKTNFNASGRLSTDFNVEPNLRTIDHALFGCKKM
jgi:hypothetical protein